MIIAVIAVIIVVAVVAVSITILVIILFFRAEITAFGEVSSSYRFLLFLI